MMVLLVVFMDKLTMVINGVLIIVTIIKAIFGVTKISKP
jgi:hypothetical protein